VCGERVLKWVSEVGMDGGSMGCRGRSGYMRTVRRLRCSCTAYAGVAGQCANT